MVFGGVGINGHYAFNEPPEDGEVVSNEEFLNRPTRVLPITRETRTINAYMNAGKGQCRKVSAKLNGQKGGRKQEAVTIVNANDGSLKTFASKQECRDFLNLASATFCKFLQGKKVRKVEWYICA